MSYSIFLRDAALNWIRGTAFPATVATQYFSVHSGNPGRNGLLLDITTTVRPAGRLAFTATNWSAPEGGTAEQRRIKNTVAVDFGSGATGTASASFLGIWDAATAGNFLQALTLSSPFTISAGVPFVFPANTIFSILP